ncbi:hypothetical protein [Tepidanaerobacter sp. EBM-38]|uniref:hypothetical protein n=1 Tax=Tepidanaerobacter sp. EBM-38 TaxID=1918496 RepID=UPI0025E7E5B3|nr:hypothetical protein [Tepidanaerobacter sp. EBM-38]
MQLNRNQPSHLMQHNMNLNSIPRFTATTALKIASTIDFLGIVRYNKRTIEKASSYDGEK